MTARSAPADPAAYRERHRVRSLAKRRAAAWLARTHPAEYQACYAQALDQVRAKAPELAAWRARERAERHALADLQALFGEEYAACLQRELAALQPDEPAVVEVRRVERPAAARARLRALLWLAGQHPDQARQRFQAEAARLPLRPADRVPGRRRALAWVRALDGLRGAYPELFEARYAAELARQVDQEPRP